MARRTILLLFLLLLSGGSRADDSLSMPSDQLPPMPTIAQGVPPAQQLLVHALGNLPPCPTAGPIQSSLAISTPIPAPGLPTECQLHITISVVRGPGVSLPSGHLPPTPALAQRVPSVQELPVDTFGTLPPCPTAGPIQSSLAISTPIPAPELPTQCQLHTTISVVRGPGVSLPSGQRTLTPTDRPARYGP